MVGLISDFAVTRYAFVTYLCHNTTTKEGCESVTLVSVLRKVLGHLEHADELGLHFVGLVRCREEERAQSRLKCHPQTCSESKVSIQYLLEYYIVHL